MKYEPTNDGRAERARNAIGGSIDELEEGIIDMLTDLRHLCDRDGLEFHELDRIAHNHYTAEKIES